MKITKKNLQNLIEKELQTFLSEQFAPPIKYGEEKASRVASDSDSDVADHEKRIKILEKQMEAVGKILKKLINISDKLKDEVFRERN